MIETIKYDEEKHLPLVEKLMEIANQSPSYKRKVGAFVYNQMFNTVTAGFNHLELEKMPDGFSNNMELKNGKTNPFVIHAEEHALNLYNANFSVLGMSDKEDRPFKRDYIKQFTGDNYHTLFTTFSPCFECAKMIGNNTLIQRIVIFNTKDNWFYGHGFDSNNVAEYPSILHYLSQSKIEIIVVDGCELINKFPYK